RLKGFAGNPAHACHYVPALAAHLPAGPPAKRTVAPPLHPAVQALGEKSAQHPSGRALRHKGPYPVRRDPATGNNTFGVVGKQRDVMAPPEQLPGQIEHVEPAMHDEGDAQGTIHFSPAVSSMVRSRSA